MTELIRARRRSPDGTAVEWTLTERDGRFVVRTGDREDVIDAPDLLAALMTRPDLTSFGASDHVTALCAGERYKHCFVAALVDREPDASFDDSRWPDEVSTPPWDECPAPESVLRRRWIEIDGAEYHPLALCDRTRLVRYDADYGEIDGGEVLARATWSMDSEVTSSSGDDSLALVGGDVLLSQQRGDTAEVSLEIITATTLVERVASWLAENTYAPAAILAIVGAPGLDRDAELRGHQRVWVDEYLQAAVLDGLSAMSDDYERLRMSLSDPASPDGSDLYSRLRGVAEGTDSLQDVLTEYI